MSDLIKAYSVLGLEPGSPKEEIQKRSKRLAMAWHPDRFPSAEARADAEEELKKILSARDVLMKHFDSGRHKDSACECSKGKVPGEPAAKAPDGKAQEATAARPQPKPGQPAGGPRAGSSSASAGQKTNTRAARDSALGSDPTPEQVRRWNKLERELEREEHQKELQEQKELIQKFFDQKNAQPAKPERASRGNKRKQRTLQDELDAGRTGNPAGAAELPGVAQVTDVVTNLFDEWKAICTSPIEYFQSMPVGDGFRDPAIFGLVIAAINGLFWFITDLLGNLTHPVHALSSAAIGFAGLIVSMLFLAGLTQFLSARLGGNGGFEASLRAVVYSFAPNVVLWIPLVQVFGIIYSLFLLKLAVEHAHEISSSRASAVVGAQVLAAILIALGLAGMGLGKLIGGQT